VGLNEEEFKTLYILTYKALTDILYFKKHAEKYFYQISRELCQITNAIIKIPTGAF
jgi:hypothetical protein